MKHIVFACNWKMYVDTPARAAALARVSISAARQAGLSLLLIPSSVHLAAVVAAGGKKSKAVSYGTQTLSAYDRGAYTGEVSAAQARASGALYALVGHSERRRLFGETDALVGIKMRRAWDAGMTPIVCVGEPKKSTPSRAAAFACAQLDRCLASAGKPRGFLYLAYEPVWAIGGDKEVDPAYAGAVMRVLRAHARRRSVRVRGVWYGGSVNAQTVRGFLETGACDGLLIGSASVDAKKITALCRRASRGQQQGRKPARRDE